MLEISPQLAVSEDELRFAFVRSSGPGGQNVNKVNSKAVLRWIPATSGLPEPVRQRFVARYRARLTAEGELIVTSQRFRDQGRNVLDCREKLRELIESVAVPPKKRRPTKPSRAAKERRFQAKQVQSRKKQNRRTVDD